MSTIETDRGTITGHHSEVLQEAQREILRLVAERNLWRAVAIERTGLLRKCSDGLRDLAVKAERHQWDVSAAKRILPHVDASLGTDDCPPEFPESEVGRNIHAILQAEALRAPYRAGAPEAMQSFIDRTPPPPGGEERNK